MGVNVSETYGGSSATFFSTVLLIEEIAKVDMSVSVMVDVHNTLVTPVLEQLGTDDQKQKYLPQLCKDTVCTSKILSCQWRTIIFIVMHLSPVTTLT